MADPVLLHPSGDKTASKDEVSRAEGASRNLPSKKMPRYKWFAVVVADAGSSAILRNDEDTTANAGGVPRSQT